MKSRPRKIENRVAQELSEWFTSLGFSTVERIPVLGRTGPDISMNELKLVIDAKSRLQCPKSYSIPASEIWQFQHLLGVRLQDLPLLLSDQKPAKLVKGSITVSHWWSHMDEWRQQKCRDGITAVVLHWPGKRVENATFLIKLSDRKVLNERIGPYNLRPIN